MAAVYCHLPIGFHMVENMHLASWVDKIIPPLAGRPTRNTLYRRDNPLSEVMRSALYACIGCAYAVRFWQSSRDRMPRSHGVASDPAATQLSGARAVTIRL
jgi:hypothetical protein